MKESFRYLCIFYKNQILCYSVHTASEPNLLKMRLKQSVIERKARICGPAGFRRHERLLHAAQRRQQKQNSALTSMYVYIRISRKKKKKKSINHTYAQRLSRELILLFF